jgi:hypothetical protein
MVVCLVMVPWKATEYRDRMPPRPNGFDGVIEEELLQNFPQILKPPFPTISDPVCLVDYDGFILSWYLPECLTFSRQVSFRS